MLHPPVHFRCTGCGECCNTPPDIALEEIEVMSAHFILRGKFRLETAGDISSTSTLAALREAYPFQVIDRGSDTAAFLLENRQGWCAARGIPISSADGVPEADGEGTFLTLSFQDIDTAARPCPKQDEDSKCTIYEDRPAKCRLVPVDESVPEPLAGSELATVFTLMKSRGWKCETGMPAPVIWENGHFVSAETAQAHRSVRVATPEIAALHHAVINEILDFRAYTLNLTREQTVRAYITSLVRGDDPALMLVPVLYCLEREDFLDRATARRILDNQIRLIVAQIPRVGPGQVLSDSRGEKLRQTLQSWLDIYRMALKDIFPSISRIRA